MRPQHNLVGQLLRRGAIRRHRGSQQSDGSASADVGRVQSQGQQSWPRAVRDSQAETRLRGSNVWRSCLGLRYVAMEWWGTSGAAPQVTGLAALILSKKPSLSVADVGDIIKKTCVPIGLAPTCAGAGLIDCLAAMSKA